MATTLFLCTVSVLYNATSPIAISQFLLETAMPVPCGLKVYFKSIAVRSYKNCLENDLLIRPDVFGTKGKGFCKRCHIDVFLAELYRVSPQKVPSIEIILLLLSTGFHAPGNSKFNCVYTLLCSA